MITENPDELLKESEEAKEKDKEMEEWQVAFDAEQKKSDLSSAMDDKLQAHQDQSLQLAKQNEQYMNDSFTKIFADMTYLKQTTDTRNSAIGSIQDYMQKENRKRQKCGADNNNFDSKMEDLDALQVKNRDALAPDKECQGDT
eukprot:5896410-Ditylum_brightwellii.AAC.1